MATFNNNNGGGEQAPATGAQSTMAEAFEYANASLALEGLAVNPAQRARQQLVIDGRLTIGDAVAQAIAAHREGT